jgi:hypothetical protein
MDPVKHSDSQGLLANRAEPSVLPRFGWMQTNLAFPVPVKVVLALFRKELYRSLKAFFLTHGFHEEIIIKGDIKNVGFSSKLGRGVGIRVGDKNISVQAREEPVHQGIGGEPCFESIDMRAKISEAFLYGIKPGFGAEKREPGRPDMCRNEKRSRARLQDDLKEVSRIESENGPPIGRDVPNTP